MTAENYDKKKKAIPHLITLKNTMKEAEGFWLLTYSGDSVESLGMEKRVMMLSRRLLGTWGDASSPSV